MQIGKTLPLTLLTTFLAASAFAQTAPPRDQFFWLGEINKATAGLTLPLESVPHSRVTN